MRVVAAAVTASVVVATLLLPTTARAEEPAGGPPYTAVVVDRALGGLDGGIDVRDADRGDWLSFRTTTTGALAIQFTSPTSTDLVLQPPTGQRFAPGSYDAASGPSSSHASLSWKGCPSELGSLTVADVTYTAAADVETITAHYWFECRGQHISGDVRLGSTTPYRAVTSPPWPSFGDVTVGTSVTRTLVLTATGTEPVTFGTATLTGVGADEFQLSADGCSGHTLAAQEQCGIDVTFTPRGGVTGATLLTVPDNSRRGYRRVGPAGRGVPPPSPPSGVVASPGVDGIGVSTAGSATHGGAPVTAYKLYRSDGSTWVHVADTTPATRWSVDPRPPGTTATYVMTAVDSLGAESAHSTPVTATVPSEPPPNPGDQTGLVDEHAATSYPTWGLIAARTTTELSMTHRPGSFTLHSADSTLAMTFMAPTGQSFTAGTYSIAPQLSATTVPPPVTCHAATGELRVHEAAQRADGSPVVFDASYTMECGDDGSRHGAARYLANRPFVAARTSPTAVLMPQHVVGGPSSTTTVTVTNAGTAPLTLGAATVAASDWQPRDNTCAGRTLGVGTSCTVGVVYAPVATGERRGVLTLLADTESGAVRVPLLGTAKATPSPPVDFRATGLVGRSLLSWGPPADDGGDWVHGYQVLRGASPTTLTPVVTLDSTARSYVDAVGRPGERRWYAVAGVNSNGVGTPATPVEVVLARSEVIYVDDPGNRGYRSLYARPLDTGIPAVALADDGRDYADPVVSPDGKYLAVGRTSHRNQFAHRVFAMPLNQVVPAYDPGALGEDTRPAWSPDSRKLAWSHRDAGESGHTTRYTTVVNSTGGVGGYEGEVPNSQGTFSPSWLPNGRELLVVDESSDTVSVLDLAGRYRRPITGLSPAYEAAASPDGSLVAWSRLEGEETTGGGEPTPKLGLRVSWVGGGTGSTVTSSGINLAPAWSADSKTIYWQRATRGGDGTLSDLDVFAAAADAPHPVSRLTTTPEVDEQGSAVRDTSAVAWPLFTMPPRPAQDFTGDGRADPAVFRPYNGNWYVRGQATVKYGTRGDVPVAADYNGDRRADRAVFRPSTGTWYVHRHLTVQFGAPGDVPVPADYNGDGRTDIAVYRPSNGVWYIRGGTRYRHGTARTMPVPADYTGDGRADIAVFDAFQRTYLLLSGAKSTVPTFGMERLPTPGDYDGNRRAEYVGYEPWQGKFVRSDEATARVRFSLGDVPVCGDYNGDRRADLALFRPVDGTWDVNGRALVRFGALGDVPV